MRITHLAASNWRNFKKIDFSVGERLFIVGPNAAGKSNLLDIFRFLSDIAGQGGGLAFAIQRRGGLKRVRSLFSRNNARGRLVVDVKLRDGEDTWRYRLSVKGQRGGGAPMWCVKRWWLVVGLVGGCRGCRFGSWRAG